MPAWQRAAGGRLEFEVASVRQEAPGAAYNGNVDLDASEFFPRYPGGPIRTSGRLVDYILFAYKIEDVGQYPALDAQLPKWAQSERFHVEARAEGKPTKDQIRVMMQSLLAERFGLKLHRETRQLQMYALVLDKPGVPGAQLRPHPDDTLCTVMPEKGALAAKGATVMPPSCMLILWQAGGLMHMRMMDFTMPLIAGNLVLIGGMRGGLDPLPVVDRTGLQGRYDIDVEFLRAPKTGEVPADSDAAEPGMTFAEALKKQTGLRLVKQVGPVDVLVVDRVEQPTEN